VRILIYLYVSRSPGLWRRRRPEQAVPNHCPQPKAAPRRGAPRDSRLENQASRLEGGQSELLERKSPQPGPNPIERSRTKAAIAQMTPGLLMQMTICIAGKPLDEPGSAVFLFFSLFFVLDRYIERLDNLPSLTSIRPLQEFGPVSHHFGRRPPRRDISPCAA